jgi:hypothetical protein
MDTFGGLFSRLKAAARRLAVRFGPSEPSPRRPNLAPPEPIPADPAEHAVDFSLRWYDRLEELTRKRLRTLGIPRDQIGAFDHEFEFRLAAFHPKEQTGGGISPGPRINLNSGIFNPDLLAGHPSPEVSSIWARAHLRNRMDAVTAHEYHEGQGVAHEEAERRAANTELPVTDGARRILRAMAEGRR